MWHNPTLNGLGKHWTESGTTHVHLMKHFEDIYVPYPHHSVCLNKFPIPVITSWNLLDLHKSKQSNTPNLNISFSMENEKEKRCTGRICLKGRCFTN